MNKKQKQKIMDSLTDKQRKGIAQIIRDADIEGDYCGMDSDGGRFWQESVTETLLSLARYFKTYNPESVLD